MEKMNAIHEQVKKELSAIMRPEQAAGFEQFWTQQLAALHRDRAGPERSARALKVILDRMDDLTVEQRQFIDTLFRAYRDAERQGNAAAGGSDQKARAEQEKSRIKKLYD